MLLELTRATQDSQGVEEQRLARARVERDPDAKDQIRGHQQDQAVGQGEDDRGTAEEEAAQRERDPPPEPIGHGPGRHLGQHDREPEEGFHNPDRGQGHAAMVGQVDDPDRQEDHEPGRGHEDVVDRDVAPIRAWIDLGHERGHRVLRVRTRQSCCQLRPLPSGARLICAQRRGYELGVRRSLVATKRPAASSTGLTVAPSVSATSASCRC